ncbi:MAG: hypothetical protein JSV47_12705 [Deltaproteobacteria bacterium]|nr:MAG: hypothetical protein JSV47_12705 [Deltaproteobacteria bacterium]
MKDKKLNNQDRGYILLIVLFMMLLLAVAALGMNRQAALQEQMAANQTQAVQFSLGQLAVLEKAAWSLTRSPTWRTSPSGESLDFEGITYTLIVQDSTIAGYGDVVTITVQALSGLRDVSMSFRVQVEKSIYIADTFNHRIRKIYENDQGDWIIVNVAGKGKAGYNGDDKVATDAEINYPFGVATDHTGNIYIADTYNHRIRKVYENDQGQLIITTFAGDGKKGFRGDGGRATRAKMRYPCDVDVGGSGKVYFADTNNYCIREVSQNAQGEWIIDTVAGTPEWPGYWGDDRGPYTATQALMNQVYGLFSDNPGNIYIADTYNHRIRRVDGEIWEISTVAGNGSGEYSGDGGLAVNAEIKTPRGVAVDFSDNIFIADRENCLIRKVNGSDQIITTVAGKVVSGTPVCGLSGDGGLATSAELDNPSGVSVDSAGNIYIADTYNCAIRMINASDNTISKLAGREDAGEPQCGYYGNGILGVYAELNFPQDVHVHEAVTLEKVSEVY